jgi:hypothetical protein
MANTALLRSLGFSYPEEKEVKLAVFAAKQHVESIGALKYCDGVHASLSHFYLSLLCL